jgi:membrane-associated protein
MNEAPPQQPTDPEPAPHRVRFVNPLWDGPAERSDWIIVGVIGFAIIYSLIMLVLTPMLINHALLLELFRGSQTAMITMGGRARIGQASLIIAVLAGIPGYMMFDWAFWWAGRRWGHRALSAMLGQPSQAAKRSARLERAMHRFGPAAVVLSAILPVPTTLVYVAAGIGRMRLWVFLALDLMGALLWIGLMVGLGYGLGRTAVQVAHTISHYSLLATLAIIALVVVRQVVVAQREIRHS